MTSLLSFILDLLRGCLHKRLSFPQSKRGGMPTVHCLDCGKQFLYDWNEMKIVRPTKGANTSKLQMTER